MSGGDIISIPSVPPLCSLCLGGDFLFDNTYHRGTENTEVAQRFSNLVTTEFSADENH